MERLWGPSGQRTPCRVIALWTHSRCWQVCNIYCIHNTHWLSTSTRTKNYPRRRMTQLPLIHHVDINHDFVLSCCVQQTRSMACLNFDTQVLLFTHLIFLNFTLQTRFRFSVQHSPHFARGYAGLTSQFLHVDITLSGSTGGPGSIRQELISYKGEY